MIKRLRSAVHAVLEGANLVPLGAFGIVLIVISKLGYISRTHHRPSFVMLGVIGILIPILILDFVVKKKKELKRGEKVKPEFESDKPIVTRRKVNIIIAIIVFFAFLCASVTAFILIWNVVTSLMAGASPAGLWGLSLLAGVAA